MHVPGAEKKPRGVTENHKEALKWFRKAADQGNASAQYNQGPFGDSAICQIGKFGGSYFLFTMTL
jgi:TPR repeat protein